MCFETSLTSCYWKDVEVLQVSLCQCRPLVFYKNYTVYCESVHYFATLLYTVQYKKTILTRNLISQTLSAGL